MNTFWLYAVLLHIVGSIVFSLTGLFPMGGLLCLTVLWGLFLYLSDRNIKNVCVILFGWLVSGILMFTMPISYGSSLLMNLLMLLLVLMMMLKKSYLFPELNQKLVPYCHLYFL